MQTRLQLSSLSRLIIGSIACALLLSACGGGGGGGTPPPGGNVTGVETPSKISVVNTK